MRDFRADSRGMHLAISASDPNVVDIYYMLIDGNKAVYVNREQVIPISGSFSMPIIKDYAWKQILENGHEYAGRVKIVELNHNQTRTFMNSFRAVDDATITETYQDETGASATIKGNSRVPFEGSLQFILSQNGSILNTTEKRTPVLLTGDDETVEITWNKTLEPGIVAGCLAFPRFAWISYKNIRSLAKFVIPVALLVAARRAREPGSVRSLTGAGATHGRGRGSQPGPGFAISTRTGMKLHACRLVVRY